MENDELFYKASGKFSLMIFLALPIMGVMVFFVTYLYAYINIYNPLVYINFFIYAGICLLLAILTIVLVRMVKSRSTLVTTLFGAAIGLTAIYFTWTLFIKVLFARFNIMTIGYDILLEPSSLWDFIMQVGDEGWYSVFGFTVSGFFLRIIWSIEALGLLAVPMFVAHNYAITTVFCEKCDRWADEKESVLVFLFSDEEELKQKFKAQDLSFLEKAERAGKDDSEFYQVDAEWCKQCDELHTLSLRKTIRTWDEDDEEDLVPFTIYEDMYVSKQTYNNVLEFSKKQRFGTFLKPKKEPLEEKPEIDETET